MFQKNQRISLVRNNSKRGRINDILPDAIFEVVWDNGDVETVREHEIEIEEILLTPWEKLSLNEFDNFRNYTISSIVNKVKNSSANTISTLKASKTIFKPYQFIPLLKLLNTDKRRIIVADEVGLGKTISAGHIILELAARGELNSLLVVCLNSLQEKWIDELLNKFNVRIEKFESVRGFKRSLKNHHEHQDKIFGVINYDKFRQKKDIEYFEKNAIGFDLIVFDEAHILRNDTNARKSLKEFVELANAVVMLTATPIMTSLENLYNLIKLLDNENYSSYQIFQNAININKPFIRAYNQINSEVSPKQIAEELRSSEIENIFKYGNEFITTDTLDNILSDDELYKSIIHELESVEALTTKKKVYLQEMLINLNSLNHFYTRTRKRDVLTEGNIINRNPHVIEVPMNIKEQQIYNDIIAEVPENIGGIQIKRKYSSSLFADNFKEEDYYKGSINTNFNDSKYSALIEIIKQQQNEKIIIFSFFRKTLLYLKNRLLNDNFSTDLIFGGIDLNERNSIIEKFRNNEFQILLSSEVGSTGLDMQFCDRMVNYDLPWNPMVVEQRIGRIDRIGQQSEVINIFNFIYKNTIEQKIYHRLYDRIGLFRESLGNLDEILGEKELYIEGEIEKLYKQNLSEDDIEERLDRIATAYERNKLDLHKIGEGLKDSFSNDFYFENEIKAIEKNKQYLTENDLVEFIDRIIVNNLTTLTLVKDRNNPLIFEINQPQEDLIFDFIQEHYERKNAELTNIFRTFKVKNRGKTIRCTFNQEYAFNNKNIEYISAYHPLINAISNYFHKEKLDRNTVFKFALNRSQIRDEQFLEIFQKGFYFLINYEFEINKLINGRTSKFNHLKSLVIDLNGNSFSPYNTNYSDLFSSICQQYRISLPEEGNVIFNDELTRLIKEEYTKFILKDKQELEAKEKLKFNSELLRKTQQEISDIDKQIERRESYIASGKGIETVLKSEITELRKRKEKINILNQESTINVMSKLISLNFVYLYG